MPILGALGALRDWRIPRESWRKADFPILKSRNRMEQSDLCRNSSRRIGVHPLEAIVLLLKQACWRRFNRLGYSHLRVL
jgi:hypothetical protein